MPGTGGDTRDCLMGRVSRRARQRFNFNSICPEPLCLEFYDFRARKIPRLLSGLHRLQPCAVVGLMPKAAKKKYYAVRRGREGPKIYETWDEVRQNVMFHTVDSWASVLWVQAKGNVCCMPASLCLRAVDVIVLSTWPGQRIPWRRA